MRVPRAAVSAALFTLLQSVTWTVGATTGITWQTADPRLKVPDDLPADAQPALFLVKPKENLSQQQTFGAPVYKLGYFALVLLRAAAVPEDVGATAENIIDIILDAIEGTLMPLPLAMQGSLQTLGGLVTHCYIDGEITIDTPVLFEQCAIWIPITVIVGG